MLTIFSIPKPFRGHIGVIQNNAIRSWVRLCPEYEIILFGDEEGTAEIAAEFGVRHVPYVERNEYGTPLMSSLYDSAQDVASHEILCVVNADIILLSDFCKAVEHARSRGSDPYLITGRRWNIDMQEHWDFSNADWEARLRAYAEKMCRQRKPAGLDYTIFPRGLLRNLPPFAVGRLSGGNWIVNKVLSQGVPVIDSTDVVTAIHQSHDYGHQQQLLGEEATKADNRDPAKVYSVISKNIEAERNRELCGGENPIVSPFDVTWVLTKNGYLKRPPLVGRVYLRMYGCNLAAPFFQVHPYRLVLRAVATLLRAFRSVRRKPGARFLQA